ncbi:MAG: Mth938-like domain-containing protein [Pseudomonadota bacterium]
MSIDITPTILPGRKLITSYGDGLFRFGEETIQGSIFLFPTQVQSWPCQSAENLDAESFAPVIAQANEVDILLLGMGPRMLPVSTALRMALKSHGIIIEPMDTGAACRTYNVLLAEERRVAAALIAV